MTTIHTAESRTAEMHTLWDQIQSFPPPHRRTTPEQTIEYHALYAAFYAARRHATILRFPCSAGADGHRWAFHQHLGRCDNEYRCTGCGEKKQVDSSD